MEGEECLSHELRGVLDEFARIRAAYISLKSYCEMQEETKTMEKERYEKMKENLEKLTKTYLLLEQRHKATVMELETQRDGLLKNIDELKEQCDHLRLINTDRSINDDQMCKLQDEVEVLKAQLMFQEEKHNEDVALLKQKHSDEIQRYKILLQNAKQNNTKSKGRPKNESKNKKNPTCFRWPELDVEKFNNTQVENDEETARENNRNKKRKLFHEDKEAAVDIL